MLFKLNAIHNDVCVRDVEIQMQKVCFRIAGFDYPSTVRKTLCGLSTISMNYLFSLFFFRKNAWNNLFPCHPNLMTLINYFTVFLGISKPLCIRLKNQDKPQVKSWAVLNLYLIPNLVRLPNKASWIKEPYMDETDVLIDPISINLFSAKLVNDEPKIARSPSEVYFQKLI